MDWVKLSPTDVHIRGYSGIAEPCLGKATVNLKMKNRCHKEDIFFSHKATSNFLSRDACKAFGIIPKGFPHEQLNSVNGGQNPRKLRNEEYSQGGGENPQKLRNEEYSQGLKAGGQNPSKLGNNVEYSEHVTPGGQNPSKLENNVEYSQMHGKVENNSRIV